jgi:uncharacterized protein DUF4159/von Willebrand factor type A domain-containing protein
MRAQLASLVLLFCLIAAPVRAADLALDLVSRSHTSRQLMLRATLTPDRPGLKARDLTLTVTPAATRSDAAPQKLEFILARLRGAYYLDVRQLPALPRGKYRIAAALNDGSGRAGLAEDIDYVPPALDVALVIDQSFSMRRNDPDRLRVAAAKAFVDLAASGNRIGSVTIIAFATRSETLIEPTAPSKKAELHKAIDRIGTLGQTNIDSALKTARAELLKGKSSGKAVVLLTDGRNQPEVYANSHKVFARAGWPVYTIGLSAEADVPTLRRIARDTGGQAFDAPSSDRLREIFSRICFTLERQVTIRTSTVSLKPGESRGDDIPIDDSVARVIFAARSTRADTLFTASAPSDANGSAEQFAAKGTYKFYAYRDPTPGTWRALLRGGTKPDRVTLETTANTPLFPLLLPLAPRYKFGEPIDIACTLANGARPLTGATLTARLLAKNGKTIAAPLTDRGDGLYAARLTGRIDPGTFTLDITARGVTAKGHPFERHVSARVVVAAPTTPEIWASARDLDLGTLYNAESASASLLVRKLLPPGVKLDLAATCRAEGIPAEAFKVTLGAPDNDGLQRLTVAATVPFGQPAGVHTIDLAITLGPKTTRVIPVSLTVVNPKLIATPDSLDLGPMLAGSTSTRRVQLRVAPRGQIDLALALDGQLDNAQSQLDKTKLRLGIAPQTVALTLGTPKDAAVGRYTGSLAITGPGGTRTIVPLKLTVAATALIASPGELDFGELQPGQSAQRKLTLRISGPVPIEAKAAAEFGGALQADSLDLHGRAQKLDPAQAIEVTATLRVPSAQPVGVVSGVVRFTTDKAIGSLPVRVKVVPGPTFAVEPGVLRLDGAAIGRTVRKTITVRSVIDRPQTLRVGPADATALIQAQPGEFTLAPRGQESITVTCTAPLGAKPGAIRKTFTIRGPMLPGSFDVEAVLIAPPGGTFKLDAAVVRLGSARPGGEVPGSIRVTSTIDLPQMISLAPQSAPDQAAWIRGPGMPAVLAARGSVTLPFDCIVSPGASSGSQRLRVMVRGPLGQQPADITVEVGAAGAGRGRNRYAMVLLLIFGMVVTAALVFLIVRALLRMPGHRMIKYFGASGVINVGFFIILTQMLAVAQIVEEPSVIVRLEEAPDIPSMASAADSPSDKPMRVKEQERDAPANRQKTDVDDPTKHLAATEQAKLEAQQRELEHERAQLDSEIDKSKLELAKLSPTQLEEVIASAEQMRRKLEAEREERVDDRAVDEPRVTAETEEQKALETALLMARAAKELQARRDAPAALPSKIDRADTRTEIETARRVENLLGDVKAAQRKAETIARLQAQAREAGGNRADTPKAGDHSGAAKATRPQTAEARNVTLTKRGTAPDAATPAVRFIDGGTRTMARTDESLADEARAAIRKTMAMLAMRAPETGSGATKAVTSGGEQPTARPATERDTPVTPKELTAARTGTREVAKPGIELTPVKTELPATPEARVDDEARDHARTTVARVTAPRPAVADAGGSRTDHTKTSDRGEIAVAAEQAPARATDLAVAKKAGDPGSVTPTKSPRTDKVEIARPEVPLAETGDVTKKTQATAGITAPLRPNDSARVDDPNAGPTRPELPVVPTAVRVAAQRGDVARPATAEQGSFVPGVTKPSTERDDGAPAPVERVDSETSAVVRKDAAATVPGVPEATVATERVRGTATTARTDAAQPVATDDPVARMSAARTAARTTDTPAVTRAPTPVKPSITRPTETLVADARGPERRQASGPSVVASARIVRGQRSDMSDASDRPLAAAATTTRTTAPTVVDVRRLTGAPERLVYTGPVKGAARPKITISSIEPVAGPVTRVAQRTETRRTGELSPVRGVEGGKGTVQAAESRPTVATAQGTVTDIARPATVARTSPGKWTPVSPATSHTAPVAPIKVTRTEDVSSETTKTAVRTEVRGTVALPLGTPRAERVGPTGTGGTKSTVAPSDVRVAAADVTAPHRVATGVPGGELLAMATRADRRPVAARTEDVGADVRAPAVARTERSGDPDRIADAARAAAAGGRAELPDRTGVLRPQVAPVEAEPTRLTRITQPRAEIGQVTVEPTAARTTRIPGIELMGKRGSGSVAFALAKYSGDWDCDKTAMPNLAYQLERRVGILLSTEARTIDVTDPKLLKQPFVFISGHKPFRFTNAELAALQRYVRAGGSLWINDSTQETDETFDAAVRRELARLLPGSKIEKLPMNHNVFKSCYNLTKGFKGYRVPPGDKYRCDYLEGVKLGGRTAIVYTRNDYGDGLEINPNTAPLMPSLTDLSPADMQEGSTRMGINIVLYFMRNRLGGASADRIAGAVRTHTAQAERDRRTAVETAETSVLDDFDKEFSWALEKDWGDTADVRAITGPKKNVRMSIQFALGKGRKIAVSRDLLEDKDFSKHHALLLDITSKMPAGCRVAVGLMTMPDWKYFESPPVYLRPGKNGNMMIRIDQPNFKTEASKWVFNQKVANLNAVRKIVLLIYPIRGGAVEIDNIRLGKLRPAGK